MKDIKGYERLYAITKDGKVYSYPKGRGKNVSGKFLTPRVYNNLNGRVKSHKQLMVILYKDGTRKAKQIHRLVAETYINNPENKPCINHIDGNPLNNTIENLEWCTHKENMQHAQKLGLLTQNSIRQETTRSLNGKKTHKKNFSFKGGA